jgi:uncharacterized protein (DUF488 family)
MSTDLIIRPKKQIRLNQIITLLGQNQNPKTIQKTLEITRTQYYRDLKIIQKEMFDQNKIRENILKILAIRENLITETLTDYKNLNQDYPAKVATCKLLKEQLTDLEVSYQRLGLLTLKEEPEESIFSFKVFEKTMDELNERYSKVLARRNEKIELRDQNARL